MRLLPSSILICVTLGFASLVAAPGAAAPAAALGAHALLERLCDDFGPRLTGSAGNVGAMDRLAAELRLLGYAPEKVPFTVPGWRRGDDRVELVAPLARRLRVAALSYAQPHPVFEAEVVDVGNGGPEDYPRTSVEGRIGLLASGTPLPTSEIVAGAATHGLRGVLFVNREGGGQLLARTGRFSGRPLPLSMYSIEQEEGRCAA